MTLPNVDNDKLILVASLNRCPVASVLLCLSEPYKKYFLINCFVLDPFGCENILPPNRQDAVVQL